MPTYEDGDVCVDKHRLVREGMADQGELWRAMWASRGELVDDWDGVAHEDLGKVVRVNIMDQGELWRAMWASRGQLEDYWVCGVCGTW